MAEVRFGVVFAEMNINWNYRVDRLVAFVGYAAAAMTVGTGVLGVGALVKQLGGTELLTWWTLPFAIAAALAYASSKAYRFGDRMKAFEVAKRDWVLLEKEGWKLQPDKLYEKLQDLRLKAPTGGGWMLDAAYNRAVQELGHKEYKVSLDRRGKIAASFA